MNDTKQHESQIALNKAIFTFWLSICSNISFCRLNFLSNSTFCSFWGCVCRCCRWAVDKYTYKPHHFSHTPLLLWKRQTSAEYVSMFYRTWMTSHLNMLVFRSYIWTWKIC